MRAQTRRSSRALAIKKRERMNHIRLLLAVTFILVSIVVAFFASTSKASETKEYTIVYESIQVTYGDTLTSIAADHNDIAVCSNADYIEEVKRLNHILDNKICAGEYLVVPAYRAD